ncbi:MAG TPA: class I SAM-dependent methyltransferase [Dehalococcoidales bacterium]|nr:class I SAM-dependent methyltransferase [Dehalococcoidales bacterium]
MSRPGFYEKWFYSGLAREPRFEKVLAIAREKHGQHLLDIGCGDGSFTVLLKDALQAAEATGIDISQEAVASAAEHGINAQVMDVDEAALPFADSCFDVIYCGEVIEHVFDTDHLLGEMRRVLKPSGYGIITTPNLSSWANRLALLFGYQPFASSVSPWHEGAGKLMMRGDEGQWGHIRVFTCRALKELVQINGFEIERLEGCRVTAKTARFLTLNNIANSLDGGFSRVAALSSRIVLVVKKS